MLAHRLLTVGAVTLFGAMTTACSASAADRNATPAELASVVAAAQGGDVIHLSAGDYGRFSGAAKPAIVTLKADPGVTATIRAELDGSSNLRFENLRVTSANLRSSTSIQFVGNTFTGSALIDTTARNGDHAIVFDGNRHDGVTVCSTCYEGRVTVHGSSVNTTPVGVTIRNSHFGGGGNSDGIQVGSYGVQVLDNEFADLPQGDPSLAHTDAIQLYGQSHTVIRGNYMHNVATGILCGDGCTSEIIENNVISTIGSYPGILLGPDRNSVVRHNTLLSNPVRVDRGNGPGASVGTVIADNIIDGYILEGSGLTTDFNLLTDGGKRGGSDVLGQPRFVGGARPVGIAGYRLADGSPGKGTASDGSDRGALIGVSAAPIGTMPAAPGVAPAPPAAGSPSGSATPQAASPHAASRLRIKVLKRMSWYRLRRGVRLRISSPRSVRLRLSLVPAGRTLPLARRSLTFRAGTRSVLIRPTRLALGKRRDRTLRLRVRTVDSRGKTTSQRTFVLRVQA